MHDANLRTETRLYLLHIESVPFSYVPFGFNTSTGLLGVLLSVAKRCRRHVAWEGVLVMTHYALPVHVFIAVP